MIKTNNKTNTLFKFFLSFRIVYIYERYSQYTQYIGKLNKKKQLIENSIAMMQSQQQ